jgi:hypothetical protein
VTAERDGVVAADALAELDLDNVPLPEAEPDIEPLRLCEADKEALADAATVSLDALCNALCDAIPTNDALAVRLLGKNDVEALMCTVRRPDGDKVPAACEGVCVTISIPRVPDNVAERVWL